MNVDMVNAKPLSSASPIAPGDCVEARRRAAEQPDLDVDVPPSPIRQTPPAFQRMPASVWTQVRRNGAVIKVNVLIDTLGKADTTRFQIVEVSNPWFGQNLKRVVPRWTFTPARLAGCKVARVYKFSATRKPDA